MVSRGELRIGNIVAGIYRDKPGLPKEPQYKYPRRVAELFTDKAVLTSLNVANGHSADHFSYLDLAGYPISINRLLKLGKLKTSIGIGKASSSSNIVPAPGSFPLLTFDLIFCELNLCINFRTFTGTSYKKISLFFV